MSLIRKRLWDRVHTVAIADGFAIRLDERPMRLPDGIELSCATMALAEAVAEEWRLAGGSNGGVFSADDMTLTTLAGMMQFQRDRGRREAVITRLLGYVDGELLCYHAGYPDALVALQRRQWQPCLDWLLHAYHIEMRITQGVMPVRQAASVHEMWRALLEGLSAAVLTAMSVVVPALGSLVLGLALARHRLSPAEAQSLARLDDEFQSTHSDVDADSESGAEAHAGRLGLEIALAARFLELAGG